MQASARCCLRSACPASASIPPPERAPLPAAKRPGGCRVPAERWPSRLPLRIIVAAILPPYLPLRRACTHVRHTIPDRLRREREHGRPSAFDAPRGEADAHQHPRGLTLCFRRLRQPRGDQLGARRGRHAQGVGCRLITADERVQRGDGQRLPRTHTGLRRHALSDGAAPHRASLACGAGRCGGERDIRQGDARGVRAWRRDGVPRCDVRSPVALRHGLAHHGDGGRVRRERWAWGGCSGSARAR